MRKQVQLRVWQDRFWLFKERWVLSFASGETRQRENLEMHANFSHFSSSIFPSASLFYRALKMLEKGFLAMNTSKEKCSTHPRLESYLSYKPPLLLQLRLSWRHLVMQILCPKLQRWELGLGYQVRNPQSSYLGIQEWRFIMSILDQDRHWTLEIGDRFRILPIPWDTWDQDRDWLRMTVILWETWERIIRLSVGRDEKWWRRASSSFLSWNKNLV